MQSLGWCGADAVVDAGDFVAFAIGFLVDEVVSAFGLSDGGRRTTGRPGFRDIGSWIFAVMDICDEIRGARGSGSTRCGVVDRRMELVDAARAFGLAADSAIYRSIGRAEADAIAAHVLHVDLAYGSEIMSLARAADLWRQFMLLFKGQDVCFATNAGAEAGSWMPATHATFDMGVLVIGATRVGCLWVEDED